MYDVDMAQGVTHGMTHGACCMMYDVGVTQGVTHGMTHDADMTQGA